MPRRAGAVVLVCVIAACGLLLAEAAGAIRLRPVFPVQGQRDAVPGQLIDVQLGDGWTAPAGTDEAVLRPLIIHGQPSSGFFLALKPGTARLYAMTIRCPRCARVTLLWSVAIRVHLPGL